MLVLMVLAAGVAGIRIRPASVHRIRIDVSRPREINAPFEIVPIGPHGERGLYIRPGAGKGWRGEAGGDATFRFEVPSDGTYHFWINALWHDACTNAIYARVDGMDKAILGNDPVFGQWHWVRGFSLDLTRGLHEMVLSNHSDNLALLEVLLTSSDTDLPDTTLPVYAELFYDGFDGCDDGNFAAWTKCSGDWKVEPREDATSRGQKMLTGSSRDTALITYAPEKWDRYVINVSARTVTATNPNASAAVCFALADSTHYLALQWSASRTPDTVDMRLLRRNGDEQDTLAQFSSPWDLGEWHDVEIGGGDGSLEAKVDGAVVCTLPFTGRHSGGIGLLLTGDTVAHFDDVHVKMPPNTTVGSAGTKE
jgi:hypothetical protein